MKNSIYLVALISLTMISSSCNAQFNLGKTIKDVSEVMTGDQPLSQQEIISGLKEALEVGTGNSVNVASKVEGYYKNPLIFIPFPPEAQKMESTLRNLGMNKQVDDFVKTLNQAAEEAAKEAKPIFVNSIKQMTVNDGMDILMGNDDAATQFFKRTTTADLTATFEPVVKRAIEKVRLTSYWNPLVTRYNKVPLVKPVNPDLDAYVTELAIDGLFKLIAIEEKKIRDNPGARVTDLLKKVFAEQD